MSGATTWLVAVWAVCGKDLRSEFRTRYALSAIGLFAITTLTVVSFALGPLGLEPEIQAALFWVILFFSSMAGLSRSFVREEEQRTAANLRLAAPATAVYWGKYLFNLLLLLLLELLIVPLAVAMMGLEIKSPTLFFLILLWGDLGLAAVSTIVAAMVVKASARGALFSVLALPLLLPLLISSIEGSRLALGGAALAEGLPSLQLLLAYALAVVAISLMLFPFIWAEA
ncbi:MAG: heme exporter protein CcmB [Chloroflexia bacterium]|nr:heme exporter protein CcmB [Chloroflexia bacterium]